MSSIFSDLFRNLYTITNLPDQIIEAGGWEKGKVSTFEKFACLRIFRISFGSSIRSEFFTTKKPSGRMSGATEGPLSSR